MTVFSSLSDLRVAGVGLPVVEVDGLDDAVTWARQHRTDLRRCVVQQGSLLVRGLPLGTAGAFGAVFRELADELLVEQEAFSPRTAYADRVYASTTWPANQPMCMHHELSYRDEVPGLLLFGCLTAPDEGGATAVADAATVLRALPADLVARFERDGWLLVRNYTEDIGVTWRDAFGTDDHGVVETYGRAHAIDLEWLPDDGLRTRQRRPAVITHPVTGVRSWFNQVAFLNEWTIAEEIRDYLVDVYGADGLPFTTAFGDGSPIGAEVVSLLNETYDAHTRREPWQTGDLLLVDNLGTAHSREAYRGPREIVVGLADPVRPGDLVGASPGPAR